MTLHRLPWCLAALLFTACPAPSSNGDAGTNKDGGTTPRDAGTPDAGHPAQTITVSGHVVYYVYDQPVAGATATLNGQSVTTDATGSFSFTGVTAPYDLTVSATVGIYHRKYVLVGLTRTDPTIELDDYTSDAPKTTTVSGTVSGVTFPLPANHYVKILSPGGSGGTAQALLSPGAATGAFTLNPSWLGDATSARHLYAVEYTLDPAPPNFPTAWGGYGRITATLTNGVTATGQNIPLTAPSADTVNVTYTEPVTPTSLSAVVGIEFEPQCQLTFEADVSGNFFATMPHLNGIPGTFAGVTAGFGLATNFYFATQLAPPATVTVSAGMPLALTPATGGDYSAGMTFSWTGASGVSRFQFYDPGTHDVVQIFTTASSINLPADFTPTSGTSVWSVTTFPSSAGTDDLAATYGISRLENEQVSANTSIVVH